MSTDVEQQTYVTIPLDRIVPRSPVRRLSVAGIARLQESIRWAGFLDNFPLMVIPMDDGTYDLIDGNHRFEAAKALGTIPLVPCVVKTDLSDLERYQMAMQSNNAAETVVASTLVTYAEFVWARVGEGYTHKQIGKMIGWEVDKVDNYKALKSICSEAWEIIPPTFELGVGSSEDEGVGSKPTSVGFTENLLRSILELTDEQQLELVTEFAHPDKNRRISKGVFKTRAENYRTRNDAKKYARDTLGNIDADLLSEFDKDVDKGWYDDDWKESAEHPKLKKRIEEVRKGWERRHSIHLTHGDFYTEIASIGNESVDLILTDPPYNVASAREYVMAGRANISQDFGEWDKHEHQAFIDLFDIWGKEWFRILRPTGSGYVFTTDIYISHLREALERMGLHVKSALVWHKTNPPPQFSKTTYRSTVEYILFFTKSEKYTFNWQGDKEEMHNFITSPVCGGNERLDNEKGETLHPTQKPEKILRHFIEVSSSIDDMVFDGFAGVGSSGKAAKDLGRKFIGIEQDETFFEAMQRRLMDE